VVDDDELGLAGGSRIGMSGVGSLGRAFEPLPRLGRKRFGADLLAGGCSLA
jgi:hypothetical protein